MQSQEINLDMMPWSAFL